MYNTIMYYITSYYMCRMKRVFIVVLEIVFYSRRFNKLINYIVVFCQRVSRLYLYFRPLYVISVVYYVSCIVYCPIVTTTRDVFYNGYILNSVVKTHTEKNIWGFFLALFTNNFKTLNIFLPIDHIYWVILYIYTIFLHRNITRVAVL